MRKGDRVFAPLSTPDSRSRSLSVHTPPGAPIDTFALSFAKRDRPRRNAVGEKRRGEAVPARAWRDEPVEPQETGCVCDRLCLRVVAFAIPLNIDAETGQSGQISQPQRSFSVDRQSVDKGADSRRKDGLRAQQRMDFRQRPVTIERCVKNVESSIAPATVRRSAQRRISTFSRHAPNRLRKGFPLERVDRI